VTLTGTEQPPAVPPTGRGQLSAASAGVLEHGLTELRATALHIIGSGLLAADPRAGLAELVRRSGDDLVVGMRRYDLATVDQVMLLGAGKATLAIAEGVAEVLGDRLGRSLIVTQRGTSRRIPGVDVREADHPVPSAASHEAGRALLDLAATAGPNDLVITAFTGGSSALACLPPEGVSFGAKQDLHRRLLASGAPIEQINAVRKHVSAVKGGRLARAAAPARIVNLTLPDVASGRLDCITDPTVTDESTVAEAVAVLRSRGLWDAVDPAVRAYLDDPQAHSPDLSDVDIHTVLLTDGEQACAAMAQTCAELGLEPHVFGTQVEGEAATVGRMLATMAVEASRRNRPFAAPCALLGAGGESVVTLSGRLELDPARAGGIAGGPNQEAALGFAEALPMDPAPVCAVFVDSDGSDGGTHNAGAIVDGTTPARAAAAGVDLTAALLRHDSATAFATLNDAVVTGPTGTNISDLWVVVIDAARS
jgi:hydroxypyruvate reductase